MLTVGAGGTKKTSVHRPDRSTSIESLGVSYIVLQALE